MENELFQGDWVMVAGEGNEVFKVKAVKGETVLLINGITEPLHKVTKLDFNKYAIRKQTSYYFYELY